MRGWWGKGCPSYAGTAFLCVAMTSAYAAVAWRPGHGWPAPADAVLRNAGAMLPVGEVGGQWWRMATAVMLNGSVHHLGDNVLVMGWCAALGEGLVGSGWIVGAFALGGLTGSLSELAADPGRMAFGSSGGVFGVAGVVVGASCLLPTTWRTTAASLMILPWVESLREQGSAILSGDAPDASPWSYVAHALGLAAGLLVGADVGSRRRRGKADDGIGWVLGGATIAFATTILGWRSIG